MIENSWFKIVDWKLFACGYRFVKHGVKRSEKVSQSRKSFRSADAGQVFYFFHPFVLRIESPNICGAYIFWSDLMKWPWCTKNIFEKIFCLRFNWLCWFEVQSFYFFHTHIVFVVQIFLNFWFSNDELAFNLYDCVCLHLTFAVCDFFSFLVGPFWRCVITGINFIKV